MLRYCRASCIVLFMGTLFFGVLYPFLVCVFGQILFPHQAKGSPVYIDGELRGLQNIGQTFSSDKYFWSRPSARVVGDGGMLVSGASNLPWSSSKLLSIIEARAAALIRTSQGNKLSLPSDLIMASASGLDPEISFKAAVFQISRVAKARAISESKLHAFVSRYEEPTLLGLFPRRVNVLKMNLELDKLFPNEVSLQENL